MPGLILHLFAGLVAGALFGVQTLIVLALAVSVEGLASIVTRGASAGRVWLLVSQVALQIGDLGGIYLRSILERVGIIVAQADGPGTITGDVVAPEASGVMDRYGYCVRIVFR
jgi:hypothetical protein